MTVDRPRELGEVDAREAPELLLVDRFESELEPGCVIGTRATSGAKRLGVDRERAISIDHGQLRIGWLAHPGWGRATIGYGPFDVGDGLVLAVRALNGLTTSQSDPRPEGRRAMLRRLVATFPHTSLRQPRLRESLTIGWFTEPTPPGRPRPIAALFHRAGDDATGELWFQAGATGALIARDLQNLPALYAIELRPDQAALYAWSYPRAHGFADPDDAEEVSVLPLAGSLPQQVYAGIHQPVLGEVKYRVDTRIESVRVWPAGTPPSNDRDRHGWWDPGADGTAISDSFDSSAGDLVGTPTSDGAATWAKVMGEGTIRRDGTGQAEVVATLAAPNPGRTVYCVPWSDETGVEVVATITPPGVRRGDGHQGRSGLVIWQDTENHLIVNHFIDDGSVGVSISAFFRTQGEETMFEWDAVWSNVSTRVQWGEPFELSVACDGRQFLCRIAGEPVLYRSFTDYRADARPLRIRGVGLAANWEWGDDTGTRFDDFRVRRLIGPGAGRAERPMR